MGRQDFLPESLLNMNHTCLQMSVLDLTGGTGGQQGFEQFVQLEHRASMFCMLRRHGLVVVQVEAFLHPECTNIGVERVIE